MRGGVTDAGRTNKQTNTEDRATQPMEAGGYDPGNMSMSFIAELSPVYCCLVQHSE